nr:MAG TPA: hypothetical protein [Caudoviricetes sp.]
MLELKFRDSGIPRSVLAICYLNIPSFGIFR